MHDSYDWTFTLAWIDKKKNTIKQGLVMDKKPSWFKLGLSYGLVQNIKSTNNQVHSHFLALPLIVKSNFYFPTEYPVRPT